MSNLESYVTLWFSKPWALLEALFFCPSKMIPCGPKKILICLGPGLSSKGLGTNLILFTCKNTWLHWTFLLWPFSKVALILSFLQKLKKSEGANDTKDFCFRKKWAQVVTLWGKFLKWPYLDKVPTYHLNIGRLLIFSTFLFLTCIQIWLIPLVDDGQSI
jgi:hypothetical protein